MRRAAEILWGGIARWRLAVLDGTTQNSAGQPAHHTGATDVQLPDTIMPDRILAFLNTVGSASPKEVAHHFSISRSSAFRRLKSLTMQNKIESFGQTNALRYSLVPNSIVPAGQPAEGFLSGDTNRTKRASASSQTLALSSVIQPSARP